MTQQGKAMYIARHYGYNTQSRKAMEEAGELIQAINKFWEGPMENGNVSIYEAPSSGEEEALRGELADMQIMIWQMCYFHGMDLTEAINGKLDRQIRRISMECGIPSEQRERILNTFLGGRR